SLINPNDFAKALAEERPGVYGRLAEELVVLHSPDYLSSVVNRYRQYDPREQQAIDHAMEQHMVARLEQLTGLPLTGDQVADAVGFYIRALKMGQNPRDAYGQRPWQEAGWSGSQALGPSFMPPLDPAMAAQIANQLGVDAGDPAVSATWKMMQQ